MDANTVALISALTALAGVIGTGLFQFFSASKKAKADSDVGYGKAILDSHNAVWGEVSALRAELKEERTQSAELSEQLRKALEKIDEVLDEKRELVRQMGVLNDKIQGLENENHILQDKVDRLTTELERARTQHA
jgi:chromosome segregation ATPase